MAKKPKKTLLEKMLGKSPLKAAMGRRPLTACWKAVMGKKSKASRPRKRRA